MSFHGQAGSIAPGNFIMPELEPNPAKADAIGLGFEGDGMPVPGIALVRPSVEDSLGAGTSITSGTESTAFSEVPGFEAALGMKNGCGVAIGPEPRIFVVFESS